LTNNIKNICVFASSSNHLDEIFYKDARDLGLLIGQNDYNIVYGGSKLGLMYACAGAVKETGRKIIGIMPEKIANFGCANPEDCDEFILTAGMRERKAKLDEISDAVIALSGGYGTLEELAEIIVQKQLAYNNKPIVILNTDGFYDKLIEFFEVIIKRNFANPASINLFYIAKTPQEAIDYIKNYQPVEYDVKYVKAKF
jgi:uncharacterized protein (TIGR00730 family)